MSNLLERDCNLKEYSPLALAFIGDGVFDLMVREKILLNANAPVGALNKQKVDIVCCKNQAKIINKLLPILSQEELAVYKRGRNAKSKPPKNATSADYHMATGLESLWGYLYLQGEINRLRELFKFIEKEDV